MVPEFNSREEWLEWRKTRIGASDVPKIMLSSTGRVEVWARLSGLAQPETFENAAMRFGTASEDFLLGLAEKHIGVELERQKVFIHKSCPILHATLDGFGATLDGDLVVVEAKCRSGGDARAILGGDVPMDIVVQVQAQLMCSGADYAYLSGMDRNTGETNIIKIYSDAHMQKCILEQIQHIIDCVKTKQQPSEYVYMDETKVADTDEQALIDEFFATKPSQEELDKAARHELAKEKLRCYAILKGGIDSPRLQCKVSASKGSVQYKMIPQLKGVNLDDYRGSPVTKVVFVEK